MQLTQDVLVLTVILFVVLRIFVSPETYFPSFSTLCERNISSGTHVSKRGEAGTLTPIVGNLPVCASDVVVVVVSSVFFSLMSEQQNRCNFAANDDESESATGEMSPAPRAAEL